MSVWFDLGEEFRPSLVLSLPQRLFLNKSVGWHYTIKLLGGATFVGKILSNHKRMSSKKITNKFKRDIKASAVNYQTLKSFIFSITCFKKDKNEAISGNLLWNLS